MPSAQSVSDLFKEYKEFKLLQKKDEMLTSQPVGAQAYVICRKWLERYQRFLLYEQFEAGTSEANLKVKPEHFTKYHPGQINNLDTLCEDDPNHDNLFGTDSQEGLAANYVDMYVENQRSPQMDFVVVHTDLWQFLFKRYGGDEILRYYIRKGNNYYTSVEVKMF